MTREPLIVSVIIPVYNVEAYLRQCLDSVVNQTLRDIEIICVDDGSTDGSAAILAEYAAKDGRVKVLHHEHTNAGAARNAGMAVATGEWLFFSDADDFSGAEMLSRMTTCDGADLADVIVAGHRTLERGVYTPLHLSQRLQNCLGEIGERPPWLFLDAGVMPWNKLFRRSFVAEKKIEFQSVSRHNDMRFVCCALAAADRIAVSNICGYVYRRGRSGGITASSSAPGTFLFADVLVAVRSELERRGLFDRAMQAYGNMALAHCCYHLLGEFDPTAFAALYAALHGHLLADLGLCEPGRFDFVNRKHCEYLKATLADETPLSLWMILLKERYSGWKELCSRNERISSLQKKAAEAEGRLATLQTEMAAVERRTEALERSVDEKSRSIAELNSQRSDLTARLQVARDANEELSSRLASVLASKSYRLGRFLACPFRVACDIIRSLRIR